MKPKKIDRHVVVIDSCNNFEGFANSKKEAEAIASVEGKDEPCSVYKMVFVSRYEPSVKRVTKE